MSGVIKVNPSVFSDKRDAHAVVVNEALRLFMEDTGFTPEFEVTPEQLEFFKGTAYNPDNGAEGTASDAARGGDVGWVEKRYQSPASREGIITAAASDLLPPLTPAERLASADGIRLVAEANATGSDLRTIRSRGNAAVFSTPAKGMWENAKTLLGAQSAAKPGVVLLTGEGRDFSSLAAHEITHALVGTTARQLLADRLRLASASAPTQEEELPPMLAESAFARVVNEGKALEWSRAAYDPGKAGDLAHAMWVKYSKQAGPALTKEDLTDSGLVYGKLKQWATDLRDPKSEAGTAYEALKQLYYYKPELAPTIRENAYSKWAERSISPRTK